MWKKIVLTVALVAMLSQQAAQAQALPVWSMPIFNGIVNRAIGAGIMANLARRGITVAANDAVFASTMSFVGKAANDASYVSAGASAVATVFGAPVWLSALIGVGALAAAGAVAWGVYQLTQTGISSAPSLSLQNPSAPPPPAPMPAGQWTTYTSPACNPAVTTTCGNNPALPSNVQWYTQGYPNSGTVYGCSTQLDCANQTAAGLTAFEGGSVQGFSVSVTPSVQGCTTCGYTVTETWTPDPSNPTVSGRVTPVSPMANPNYQSPGQTGTLMNLQPTAAMLQEPFPQSLTASMADQLWRNASMQPGYNGYPYDATNPVSRADVATAPVAPTWNDVVEGMPRPSGSTSVPIGTNPIPNTPYVPGTTSPPSPGSGTTGTTPMTQNPCELNPNASACAPLGSAPPAPPIPSSSANVSMTPWSVGAADGVCPAPQVVSVLGSSLSLSWDPMCSFVQKVRTLVLAICALAAALIVAMGVSL
ncbi:hypothetical protein KDX23_21365 [Burkholderia vietnamiensis]|uniref:virulence factor TspB C-terminal domain-related protein n=1 Tax=Burkholderia vietnamiensis TaxID=60552 RepID=UPI001B8F3119|nr:virulence factor TspB C-terminal domain-related protein [Burkholderia vietnamiensis]MBR8085295.1 hypothetical protein [Burkholderia vietnamiensis]